MQNKIINEGLVSIKIPEFEKVSSKAPVFYNPVMELNRDLSVIALNQYQKMVGNPLNICDAFGGSGIRGIRYSKEIDSNKIITNDVNPLAIDFIRSNIDLNKVDNVSVCREDANLLLRKCKGKFDVVDIDPFGTPSYYIESAAISLKSGGLLCVSATDTSSLCGTYKNPCIRKYSSKPLKTEYCHENGIRILIGFIARVFAKYKKSIQVQFSHSSEHYMRIYLTIQKGAAITDQSLMDIGFILHCKNCLNRDLVTGFAPFLPSICPVCDGDYNIAGPLWCGKIFDSDFINGMINITDDVIINKKKEVYKLLNLCREEADGPPTFFDLHRISKKLKMSAPPLDKVLTQLLKEGYFASRTHFKPTGIRTNASIETMDKIILSL
ncbi:MAG: tRNA (guanine(10)-N(2))-dimethyltransferase [Methanobacteriaceae archaeon]|nr:tRNA (guanine(10)-N(2))-dimethyltransferase [Methanobacteriaceae archaeon]